MKNPLHFAPLAMIGMTLASLPLLAVDLRAEPTPPVPPGNSLPPPQPEFFAPTSPTVSSTQPLSPGKHGGKLKKLKNELGLTPDQVARIKPIVQNTRQQIIALRSNTALPQKQKRREIRQIRASSFQQIRPILTRQQLQKWKEIREERHAGARKV